MTDKSGSGNDAEVTRQAKLIEGGAPQGSSPETAAQLNNGLLNVPGINLSDIISGEGRYTYAAWLNP